MLFLNQYATIDALAPVVAYVMEGEDWTRLVRRLDGRSTAVSRNKIFWVYPQNYDQTSLIAQTSRASHLPDSLLSTHHSL